MRFDMSLIRILVATVAFSLCLPAVAGPDTAAVERCLSDNTNGKERKDLARWIFLSIAAHPEIKSLSKATREDNEQSSKVVAGLFTRLVSDNCSNEIRAMIKSDGPQSLSTAFEFLGRLAMQELTANPEVAASVSAFQRYVDRSKLSATLDPR
jgi:hypothetical protein